jgi:hypothetical protein
MPGHFSVEINTPLAMTDSKMGKATWTNPPSAFLLKRPPHASLAEFLLQF